MATSQNPNASAKENVQEFDTEESDSSKAANCNQQLVAKQAGDCAGIDGSNVLHTNKDTNIKDLPGEDES